MHTRRYKRSDLAERFLRSPLPEAAMKWLSHETKCVNRQAHNSTFGRPDVCVRRLVLDCAE
jgi:hypothetical protein